HALGRALQRVEILGNGFPIPSHPCAHRLNWDRLVARHRQHGAFAILGLDRREPEPAIAEHHRGYAVPSGVSAPRIPANLGVVMGMEIDETGGDDETVSIDRLAGQARHSSAKMGDSAVPDPDVASVARDACSIDNCSAFDVNIEVCHRTLPSKPDLTATRR